MKENRRSFIKKGAALMAASVSGLGVTKEASARAKALDAFVRDAGMEMSLAYFWGPEKRRIALAKQMAVYGAVGGIHMGMTGISDARPWDLRTVKAVKEKWKEYGLNFNVVEGPPTLGSKTKLGLEGRDEEIGNFIQLMHHLSQAGVDIICYNWMPVISWARTTTERAGRGGLWLRHLT